MRLSRICFFRKFNLKCSHLCISFILREKSQENFATKDSISHNAPIITIIIVVDVIWAAQKRWSENKCLSLSVEVMIQRKWENGSRLPTSFLIDRSLQFRASCSTSCENYSYFSSLLTVLNITYFFYCFLVTSPRPQIHIIEIYFSEWVFDEYFFFESFPPIGQSL